jgi:carbonic anhydrase
MKRIFPLRKGAMDMCNRSKTPQEGRRFDRRSFLKGPIAAAAVGLLGGSVGGRMAYAAALTKEQRDRMTPDEIIAEMQRGNERFRMGKAGMRNFLAEQQATATGQYPAAVVLSCIDSRAPAEVIMDLGIGDVFNARVAGNIANEDILGSMEFACQVAGAKVVLVMGHTSCGAVKGAIDNAELGHLTSLLAKIRPAVQATAFEGERSSKDPAYVDAVARRNVELTMMHIREKSAVLRERESKRALKIAGAMYHLDTATVDFFR